MISCFSDGSDGSVFIITRVNSVISKTLLIYMFFAIVIILIVTSVVLTQWIYKSVFAPINRLNVAMQNIAEGNFEYILTRRIPMKSASCTAIMRTCGFG